MGFFWESISIWPMPEEFWAGRCQCHLDMESAWFCLEVWSLRFPKNDLIIVKESKELQVNDIVVYEAGKQLVVHRVIQIEGNEVTMQGDANNAADEPFSKDKVLGTVKFRIAGAGRWVTALRKPWVMLLLIAMVFALEEYFFQKQQEKEDEELVALQEEIRKLKENSSL